MDYLILDCFHCGRSYQHPANVTLAKCQSCGLYCDKNEGRSQEHNERLTDDRPGRKLGTFEQLGTEIGKLTDQKQGAYGDSFGKAGDVMRILYPNGITGEQMDDALAVVRVIDKLFRIATQKDAFGESPWRDIAGYGLLGAARCPK